MILKGVILGVVISLVFIFGLTLTYVIVKYVIWANNVVGETLNVTPSHEVYNGISKSVSYGLTFLVVIIISAVVIYGMWQRWR